MTEAGRPIGCPWCLSCGISELVGVTAWEKGVGLIYTLFGHECAVNNTCTEVFHGDDL